MNFFKEKIVTRKLGNIYNYSLLINQVAQFIINSLLIIVSDLKLLNFNCFNFKFNFKFQSFNSFIQILLFIVIYELIQLFIRKEFRL